MSSILETWQAMENSDREHELFLAYYKAREDYLGEIRSHVKGNVASDNIPSLYAAERAAFGSYLEHRTRTKPA